MKKILLLLLLGACFEEGEQSKAYDTCCRRWPDEEAITKCALEVHAVIGTARCVTLECWPDYHEHLCDPLPDAGTD